MGCPSSKLRPKPKDSMHSERTEVSPVLLSYELPSVRNLSRKSMRDGDEDVCEWQSLLSEGSSQSIKITDEEGKEQLEELEEQGQEQEQEQGRTPLLSKIAVAVFCMQSNDDKREIEPEKNAADKLGFFQRRMRQKAFLLVKGSSSIILRAADVMLDYRTALKFYMAGHKWWAGLSATFTLTSPLSQFIYVKFNCSIKQAWLYVIPGSCKHLVDEARQLRFISRLPQSSLYLGVHILAGSGPMNEVLAAIESVAESLPQLAVQCRAFYVIGGDYLNIVSLVSSAFGVAVGAYAGYAAFMRRVEVNEAIVNVWGTKPKEEARAATAHGIWLSEIAIDGQTSDALIWLASSDMELQACCVWKHPSVGDEFVIKFARASTYLQVANFSWTSVSNLGVMELAKECAGLQTVNLSGTKVDNEGVKELAQKCAGLQTVNLSDTKVDNEGVKELAQKCAGLQTVNLSGTKVDNEGVKELAQKCAGLQTVGLSCTKVDNEGVKELAQKCAGLQTVHLFDTKVDNEGVKELAQKCAGLQTVNLSCTKVDNEGVKELAQKCAGLQTVHLSDTKVDNEGVKELAQKCVGLQTVYLFGTKVDNEGKKELQLCRTSCVFLM